MPSRDIEGDGLPCPDIQSPLLPADACCRLEGHPELDFRTVGDAAVDAAGAVFDGPDRPVLKGQGIIVLGSLHPCGRKSVTELDPAYSRNREQCM